MVGNLQNQNIIADAYKNLIFWRGYTLLYSDCQNVCDNKMKHY